MRDICSDSQGDDRVPGYIDLADDMESSPRKFDLEALREGYLAVGYSHKFVEKYLSVLSRQMSEPLKASRS